jgi:putative ABC transport system ATP-binding protein
MQYLIEFKNVEKSFEVEDRQVPILHDINLAIKPNSFVIVYGPSGSGKSTLLNIMMGLEPPTKGSVRIDGQEIYNESARSRALYRSKNLGAIYQSMYWIKSLSVIQNVALPLMLAGQTRAQAQATAMQKLKLVGMDKFARYAPTLLSGGQQQRVAMARALVSEPSILVADEPTGNLDSKTGDAAMQLLCDYHKKSGCTVILVTHNLEYLAISRERYYMQDGNLSLDKDVRTEHVSRLVSQMRHRLDTGGVGSKRSMQ